MDKREYGEKLNRDNLRGLQKFTLILLFFFLLFQSLYLAREFFIPFSFASLLAMLMAPVANKLEKLGVNKTLSTLLCILLIIIIFVSLVALFTTQIMGFASDLPELQQRLNIKIEDLQSFIQKEFDVAPSKQIEFAKARLNNSLRSADVLITRIIGATTGTVTGIALLLIYIFFFVFYRKKFATFIQKVVSRDNHTIAKEISLQISQVTQQYLVGVLTVIIILAVLNTVGLFIIGIRHAIFFGVLAAILNIVPYIGVLVGSLFPITLAILTKDTIWSAVAVAGVFTFNQFLENNFLTPKITGSKVKINPLAAIIALIIGGMVWGVAGTILFIPFIGIVKILFDNIESLKPFGYLIGEDEDENENEQPGMIKRLYTRIRNRLFENKKQ